MINAILIALLVALAASLFAAIVGVMLRPRPQDGGFQVATRDAHEDLRNCHSRGLPSGEAGTVAGRMYAVPPSFRAFFRRAL